MDNKRLVGSVPQHRNEEVCSSSCPEAVLSLIILLQTNYNLYLSVCLFVCFYFSSERHISSLSNQILCFQQPMLPDCEKHKSHVSLRHPETASWYLPQWMRRDVPSREDACVMGLSVWLHEVAPVVSVLWPHHIALSSVAFRNSKWQSEIEKWEYALCGPRVSLCQAHLERLIWLKDTNQTYLDQNY